MAASSMFFYGLRDLKSINRNEIFDLSVPKQAYELQDNIEQPARCFAQSGRLPAN